MSRKAIRQKTIRQKTIRLKTNDRTLDRYAHILKPLGYYPQKYGWLTGIQYLAPWKLSGVVNVCPKAGRLTGMYLICGFRDSKGVVG